MNEAIVRLREEINAIDDQLVSLLRMRLDSVKQLYQIKAELDLPIYDPSREKELMQRLKNHSNKLNLDPDYIESLFRRIILQSYIEGNKNNTPKVVNKNIIILGANGKMGKILMQKFKSSGFSVTGFESTDDWDNSPVFDHCDLVLVCVPIESTLDTLKRIKKLPTHCVLADITSIKSKTMKLMLKRHPGPVLGLHPMFGPNIQTFVNQLIIACPGRGEDHYSWVLDLFQKWGARIETCTAKTHDKMMRYIQALNHMCNYVTGIFLIKEKVDLELLGKLSSQNYQAQLVRLRQFSRQSPKLFYEIISASVNNLNLLKKYIDNFDEELKQISCGNKSRFIKNFNKLSSRFDQLFIEPNM